MSVSLRREISWNLVSFVIQGIGLLGLQVLIANYFETSDLGIFNQVYAAFILFSQLAVGGVHLSVQKFISEDNSHHLRNTSIARAGLLATLVLSLLWTILFYCTRYWVAGFLSSPSIEVGIALATPGLFFFALNKTLLGMINGQQRMKLYAIVQALRPILLLLSTVYIYLQSYAGLALSAILTVSEVIVFVVLALTALPDIFRASQGELKKWTSVHLQFGVKGLFSGVLSELNTRVDVLMLGYFLSDRHVGIYSFAAIFAEGLSQLPAVFRANMNPRLSRMLATNNKTELQKLIGDGVRTTYKYMFLVSALSMIAYPFVVPFVTHNPDLQASWLIYSILAVGVFLQSGYSPFYQLLIQAGHPWTYTIQIAVIVLINVILNFLLIPMVGAEGAAIATLISWVASVPLFKWFSQKKVALQV